MITRGQSNERPDTLLHVKIEQLLTEARVVPARAPKFCSAFQLAIVLTQSFEQLPRVSIVVHIASLFLMALAVMMLMAPAPYHRIVYAGRILKTCTGSAVLSSRALPCRSVWDWRAMFTS